jgi:hypothetical protein
MAVTSLIIGNQAKLLAMLYSMLFSVLLRRIFEVCLSRLPYLFSIAANESLRECLSSISTLT